MTIDLQHHRSAPSRHRHVVLAVATSLGVVAGACTGDGQAGPATSATSAASVTSTSLAATSTSAAPTSTLPGSTTTEPAPTTTVVAPPSPGPSGLRSTAPFSDYRWVEELDDTATYAGPATPHSFGDVLLVPQQEYTFGPDRPAVGDELVDHLEADGFVVQSGSSRFFHDQYKSAVYSYMPLFVTTDSMYHTWHLVFDKVLRDTEQQRLLPTLEHLLAGAVDAARAQERSLVGTELADAAHRTTAYYESAASLVGVDVGDVNELAVEEIDLVEAAVGIVTSPITGSAECAWPDSFVSCVDYSLFRPRGHYTRTPELQRYFEAMSVLGQEGFALAQGVGVVPGALTTRVLVSDPALLADWAAIYEPTAFLVGLADDIGPGELAAVLDAEVPAWRTDPSVLAGADAEAIAAAVLEAHPVAIDPERAGVRVMGARFTLDSYVLDQLAWPNVGTPDDRRVHVSALDLAAAFGSPLARDIQLSTEAGYLHYEQQLDATTDLVGARRPDDWAGTVYDAWLAAITPQFHTRGTAYPDFMRTSAWGAKALQTGLASYTELKHDTVLYAKQGSAGEGEGPLPGDFEPRNWVEPDPVSFGRIAAAAELLRDGFDDRDLLTPETDDLLGRLIELSDWLAGIASRELAGDVATDDENARLYRFGSELEYLWYASSELELDATGSTIPGPDERAGLVTDIFTSSFDYLQLGTGAIDTIYVVVPLGDGRFELAVGGVASYYEFWRSTAELRLTDEEWRAMLAEGEQPVARPAWTAPFLVGAEISTTPRVES